MNVSSIQAVGSEYKLKAAYLYQFTKFVQWPKSQFIDKDSPIQICILGRNPFGELLGHFSKRASQKRHLSVEYLQTMKGLSSCHIIFISISEEKRLTQILKKIEGKPILSVSDMDSFAHRGGMIGFVPSRRTIGLEINVDASLSSGTQISSKLLKISTVVHNHNVGVAPK